MTQPYGPPRYLQELMARIRHLSEWGYPTEATWSNPWADPPSGPVQAAEAQDNYRTFLARAINGEATATQFYSNIAEALQEQGLAQAAKFLQEASRDEHHHLALLQQRYRVRYGTTHEPVLGNTSVTDLRTALTEALVDEIADARRYRDAYLNLTDPFDQRLFFELATDELRHGTMMTYSLQALH